MDGYSTDKRSYPATAKLPLLLLRDLGAQDNASAIDLSAVSLKRSDHEADLVDVTQLFAGMENGVEIAFFTDTDGVGDTFSAELFAFRDGKHSFAAKVFEVNGAIGSQKCDVHPVTGADQPNGLWAGTLTLSSDAWKSSDGALSGVKVIDSGSDRMARLVFDLRGYRLLLPKLFAADGIGIKCGSVGMVICAYG